MPQSYQGTPKWYGGGTGILKDTLERAQAESRKQYEPFPGELVAPFSPLQERATRMMEQESENPEYQQLLSKVSPLIDRSLESPHSKIDQYMNPYNERVLQNIERLQNRNLTENLLPSIRDRFIKGGQYGSTGHQDFTNRALRDTQESIAGEQAKLLYGGFNKALDTAVGQQELGLKAATTIPVVANASQEARNNQIENLYRYGTQQQLQHQNELDSSHNRFQEEKNYPYEQTQRLANIVQGIPQPSFNYSRGSNHGIPPYLQQPAKSSAIGQLGNLGMSLWAKGQGNNWFAEGGRVHPKRYASGGHVSNRFADGGMMQYNDTDLIQNMPQQSDMDDVNHVGGYLSQLMNPSPTPSYKRGGSVRHIRHYAEGGGVPNNPIHKGVNDAFDTASLNDERMYGRMNFDQPYTRDLEMKKQLADRYLSQNVNPFWEAISQAGLAMAKAPPGRMMDKIVAGVESGMQGYDAAKEKQLSNFQQAASIQEMIGNTQRKLMDERKKRELEERKNKYLQVSPGSSVYKINDDGLENVVEPTFKPTTGSSSGEFVIKKGQDGRQYRINKNTGESNLIEGMGESEEGITKEEAAIHKKSDINSIEDARTVIHTAPKLKKILQDMRKVASRLNSGGYSGSINEATKAWFPSGVGTEEDINTFKNLQAQLVLEQERLKSMGRPLASRLALIGQSKPLLTNKMGANITYIDNELQNLGLDADRAHFIQKNVNVSGKSRNHGLDVEAAYDEWLQAKQIAQENGYEFNLKPTDFLNKTREKVGSKLADEEESKFKKYKNTDDYSDDDILSVIGGIGG